MDEQKVGGREGGREGGWMVEQRMGGKEGGRERGRDSNVLVVPFPSPCYSPLHLLPTYRLLALSSLPHSVLLLQEFYGDYIAVAQHLFSFNIEQCAQPGLMWRREEFLRVCDGLVSVLLALRKKPLIR